MGKEWRGSAPLSWFNITTSDGKIKGSYAIDKGILVVRRGDGSVKRTQASSVGQNEVLARTILSETSGWESYLD